MPRALARTDVVRLMRAQAEYYRTWSIENVLDDAFTKVDSATARMCFYNCFGHG
jgi:hypothetical protein